MTTDSGGIAARWRDVRRRVDEACDRAGRTPTEVTLVAVSKTQPASAVCEVAAAGATDFGENYAQELADKRAQVGALLGPDREVTLRWHFIGRLQRNKAKLVAGHVALVHAVDSLELARELGRRASSTVQPCLLSINAAGEGTKGGISLADAPSLAADLCDVPGFRLDGLMTMPPPTDDPEASRPYFVELADLRARLQDRLSIRLPVLSMGMSHDFEVAIACGATHVRVGTAIFGARPR